MAQVTHFFSASISFDAIVFNQSMALCKTHLQDVNLSGVISHLYCPIGCNDLDSSDGLME